MQDHLSSQPTDRRAMIAGIGGLAAGALLAGKAAAGPLTPPPGPIASTPGPEPRIAVNSTNTPGDASHLFRIRQPGSYYLEANVVGQAGINGIAIDADNVTLDLNGFSILGVSGSRSAIRVFSASSHLTIRNGSIRSWPENGIVFENVLNSVNVHVESLTIAEIGLIGVMAPNRATIRNCIIERCASDGIRARSDANISDCVLFGNTGRGIQAQDSAIITRCSVRENTGAGIVVGVGSIVSECSVRACGSVAIAAQSGCRVSDNVLQDNQGGITADFYNLITGNTVARHVATAGSYGIRVNAIFNRVESNCVVSHMPGIELVGNSNVLIRNSVASSLPYLIAPSNAAGPIILRNELATNTNPNANYIH